MNTETGITAEKNAISLSTLLNCISFQHGRLTMLQIYVTLWGNCVCACVFVCLCISLLSTFITLSTLQNPFDKHIAYFNQNS